MKFLVTTSQFQPLLVKLHAQRLRDLTQNLFQNQACKIRQILEIVTLPLCFHRLHQTDPTTEIDYPPVINLQALIDQVLIVKVRWLPRMIQSGERQKFSSNWTPRCLHP